MPGTPRPERVADQIQIELADILARRLKDPRHGFLTITAVEVTRDLRLARIYVSSLDERDLEESLSTLVRAKGFLRTELGRRIRLRFMPDLEFRADRSASHALHVASLLRGLETGELSAPADEDTDEA